MPNRKSPQELFEDVRMAREKLIARALEMTPAQVSFQPAEKEWSVLEVLEHLALADVSGVSKIWSAAEAVRAGRNTWQGENVNRGLPIEEIVARTWKPRAVAAPIATPHFGGPLDYWVAYLRNCQPLLEALGPVLEGLDLESIIHPHFLCGPLSARQRLEFLRFHIEWHLPQIERIRSAPAFPA